MYNFNQSNVIMRWLIHVIISWGEKNLKMFNVKFKVWAKKLKSKFKRWSTSFNVIRNSELKWLENVKVLNYQLSKNLNVLVKYNSKKYTKSEKSEKSSESGNPGSKSKSLSPSPTSTPSRRTTGLIQIKLKSKTDPGIWKIHGIRSERLSPGIVSERRESEAVVRDSNLKIRQLRIDFQSSMRMTPNPVGLNPVILCCMLYLGGVPNGILKYTKS